MMANCSKCAYCGSPIEEGQRWVREKIFEPAFTGLDPTYLRYHVELFPGQELSCWEKHQMKVENSRIMARAA
jgi:hypothetical protein